MHAILENALLQSLDSLVPMTVGRHTYGKPKIVAYGSALQSHIKIGSFCSIAKEVVFLLGGNHNYENWTTYPMNLLFDDLDLPWHESSKGGINIGDDVWIGYGATILDGSVIGTGSVIGAKSVVAGHIPPCSIVVGNPARVIKQRFQDMDGYLESRWWERSDDEIKQLCNYQCKKEVIS
jgi:acetyltransferase-like isoleucine patch superfamily enzyme